MKRLVSVVAAVLMSAPALAHPSTVSHEHPHGFSILPDLTVMLLAAVIMVSGFVALRRFWSG